MGQTSTQGFLFLDGERRSCGDSWSRIFLIPGFGRNISVVPLLASLGIVVALTVSYTVSISLGHAVTVWPFISDVATCRPETSLFAMIMNPTALLTALTYYIQHHLWNATIDGKHQLTAGRKLILQRINRGSLLVGLFSSLSLYLAAEFPMGPPSVLTTRVHRLAAFANGWSCYLYWCLQLALESLTGATSPLFPLRRLLVALGFLFGCGFCVCRPLVSQEVADLIRVSMCGSAVAGAEAWIRSARDMRLYAVSAICQWLMVLLTSASLMTLSWEFQWVARPQPNHHFDHLSLCETHSCGLLQDHCCCRQEINRNMPTVKTKSKHM